MEAPADNSHFHKSKHFQEGFPSSSTSSSATSSSTVSSFSSYSTSVRKELMELFDRIQREVGCCAGNIFQIFETNSFACFSSVARSCRLKNRNTTKRKRRRRSLKFERGWNWHNEEILILANTFYNLNKYIWQFEQIHFSTKRRRRRNGNFKRGWNWHNEFPLDRG